MKLETITDVCEHYGLRYMEIAEMFDIPRRTIQDWYTGKRTPPQYTLNLIVKALEYEMLARNTKKGE